MKRVLVGALHHESNSFNPVVVGRRDFSYLKGEELFENIRENDSLSGLIVALQKAGYEVIPTVSVRAVPNGLVDRDFYLEVKEELLSRAREASKEGTIDGICLSLHGSMGIKDYGEAEGPLLEELRELFPDIPIYCSLDMHATMTPKMHRNCQGFVGYKTAPHIDCTEAGTQAARMMIRDLGEGIGGTSAWVRIPILIAGEQSGTKSEPMLSLIEALRRIEETSGVLAASYLMGFPWADNSDSGLGVYVVTEDNQALANKLALDLAWLIWDKRYDFDFVSEAYSEKETLNQAFKSVARGESPVYISDSGDNPTAGASSDNTNFLKCILEDARVEELEIPIIYGGFYDPQATRACENKLGEELELSFGAAFDDRGSSPIRLKGYVKGYYKNWGRYNFPRGDLALFSSGGVDIVLAEEHIGFTDPQLFRDLGLEPEKAEIIVCKLGYLTPGHEALAERSILALTQGNTNEDLKANDYKLVKRPIFPLDEDFHYNPQAYLYVEEDR